MISGDLWVIWEDGSRQRKSYKVGSLASLRLSNHSNCCYKGKVFSESIRLHLTCLNSSNSSNNSHSYDHNHFHVHRPTTSLTVRFITTTTRKIHQCLTVAGNIHLQRRDRGPHRRRNLFLDLVRVLQPCCRGQVCYSRCNESQSHPGLVFTRLTFEVQSYRPLIAPPRCTTSGETSL